jgi:hypothetical protein
MSENENIQTEPKVYESKVLLAWETPENIGKIVFPKKNCACRRCPFMDWQVLEVEQEPDDEQTEKQEPTTMIEIVNYCHDRYKETWGRGLPNIPDCDGLYKQPRE